MTKPSEMSKAERAAVYIQVLNHGMIECGRNLELTPEETLDLELRHSVETYTLRFGAAKTAELLMEFGKAHFNGLLAEFCKPRYDA